MQLLSHTRNLENLNRHNEDVIRLKDYENFHSPRPFVDFPIDEVRQRKTLIDQMAQVEGLLVVCFVIDLLSKLVNHYSVLRWKRYDRNRVKGKQRQLINVLFDQGFIYIKGEPLISTSILVLDALLLSILVLLFLFETTGKGEGSIGFCQVGSLLVARFLLRLPFMMQLLFHHYLLNLCRLQHNLIFPNRETKNFCTYKEKVLYIIEQIRQQFGKVIYMSHPNNDLAWCQFVIENDYL